MGLEEETIEDLEAHCVECGAVLNEKDAAEVLESEGPNLCSVCAAEIADVD
ncbi:MAG: hypothetical protein NTX07_06380 [Solirubrobacterales bacterium]|nr:hypothetical protein [Solirubrobacterales bacterium]